MPGLEGRNMTPTQRSYTLSAEALAAALDAIAFHVHPAHQPKHPKVKCECRHSPLPYGESCRGMRHRHRDDLRILLRREPGDDESRWADAIAEVAGVPLEQYLSDPRRIGHSVTLKDGRWIIRSDDGWVLGEEIHRGNTFDLMKGVLILVLIVAAVYLFS